MPDFTPDSLPEFSFEPDENLILVTLIPVILADEDGHPMLKVTMKMVNLTTLVIWMGPSFQIPKDYLHKPELMIAVLARANGIDLMDRNTWPKELV